MVDKCKVAPIWQQLLFALKGTSLVWNGAATQLLSRGKIKSCFLTELDACYFGGVGLDPRDPKSAFGSSGV